jgi:hypothetical protein
MMTEKVSLSENAAHFPQAVAAWGQSELDAMLACLADPEKPAIEIGDAARREQLMELARVHGVDSIVWRKFGGGLGTAGDQEMLHRIGQAMLLNRLRLEIDAAFAAGGVQASVVKGPVFAAKLYGVRGDRLYTDIDLMVEPGALERANAVMRQLGYVREDGGEGLRRSLEYKFAHPDYRHVLIELHGDMVHYPLLRRRAAFGRDELLRAGDGDAEAAGALLATAIVHATLGHKFERLSMLVDVLQAVRHLPREDYRRFADTLCAMRLGLECAVCLAVTARLFHDAASAELEKLFHAGLKGRFGKMLITPRTLIAAQGEAARASWLRRKSFRLVQYLP